MPGLLDIATSARTVEVQGTAIPIYGVSARGIAYLLERFPELRKLFSGQQIDFTPEAITQLVPDAIAAIIAAGTGTPGDKQAELTADNLPAGEQADLLKAIFDVTMPKGARPFVDKLIGLSETIGGVSMSTPDMKSPQQSSN